MSRTKKGSKGPGYEYWKSRLHRQGEKPGKKGRIMNPGPELDKLTCEIVGIQPRGCPCGKCNTGFAHVSTSLGECEPVLEWLRDELDIPGRSVLRIQAIIGCLEWCIVSHGLCGRPDEQFPIGQTIQHAACLAVLAIHDTFLPNSLKEMQDASLQR